MRVMKKVAPNDPVKDLAKEIAAEVESEIIAEWKKSASLKLLWNMFCIKKGLREKPKVAPVVYTPYIPIMETDLTKSTGIGNLNGSSNLNQRYPKHSI